MGAVTSEALSTAERAIHKVDQAIETLEHLRLELVAIAIGERWHQVERPPQIDDLARELGELAALLQVREVLARKEARPRPKPAQTTFGRSRPSTRSSTRFANRF